MKSKANLRPESCLESFQIDCVDSLHAKYLSYFDAGNNYYSNTIKLLSRNVLYYGSKHYGLSVRKLVFFYDVFRGKNKATLMPFVNLINAFNWDASKIFNCDLISDDVLHDCVHPGFNINTYRLPTDNW